MITLSIIIWIFLFLNLLPFFPFQHWVFRVGEFGKLHFLFIEVILLICSFFILDFSSAYSYILTVALLVFIYLNAVKLYPFTGLYKYNYEFKTSKRSKVVTIISSNVYQFNTDYKSFIDLINKYQPDMFLTMESDKKWGEAMEALDKDYPYSVKKALQNTYGIHLFSKLKLKEAKVNFFVSDDIPSIEAKVETCDGYDFKFYGIHPPPPSPTEESNSKERDGELLSIARDIEPNKEKATIVMGDFNNVAWAKSSELFRKYSGLLDPRRGRGFFSTFHAKYWFLRIPIDLCYHSGNLEIEEIRPLENIGSDHLPLLVKFKIADEPSETEKDINYSEAVEIKNMISEGKIEEGDREDFE